MRTIDKLTCGWIGVMASGVAYDSINPSNDIFELYVGCGMFLATIAMAGASFVCGSLEYNQSNTKLKKTQK